MALPVVLGSSSVFRQRQLAALGLDFAVGKPVFDEAPLAGESARETALRLAMGKAKSLVGQFPAHLIIGADQVAWCDGRQLGKPMSADKAAAMLGALSGREIVFYSAVCVLDSVSGCLKSHVDETVVRMRTLSAGQIARYLAREPDAIFCAGAAKSEGLGAALLERVDCSDPNALIGLPIFWVVGTLGAFGVEVV